MNMKKSLNLCNDLINIFTDYAYTLDVYFKDDQNKLDHKELYEVYLVLNMNLKKVIKRNGVIEK